MKAGALAQLLDRPLGVKGASNPVQAAGGVDPEPEAAARASIPLAVRTLGRAVSLLDYADFARAFAGVAKAHAAVLPLRDRAGRSSSPSPSRAIPGRRRPSGSKTSADALRSHGDPRVEVVVAPGHEETVRLALRVARRPGVRERRGAGRGRGRAARPSTPARRGSFVEPLHRSEIVASAHRVAGVRRGRRRPRSTPATRPASPTGCSPASRRVGPGGVARVRPGS